MQVKETPNHQSAASVLRPEKEKTTPGDHVAVSFDSLSGDVLHRSTLPESFSTFPWLNAPMRRVSEERYMQAKRENLPYVVARQQVGDNIAVLDGGLAHSLSTWGDSKTKFFDSSGFCWNGNREKTQYLVHLPGVKEPVPIGNEESLFQKKLSLGQVSLLLSINELQNDETEDKDDYLPQSRIVYYLLLSIGHVFERDLSVAERIIEPLNKKLIPNIVCDVMVISAGSAWPTLLDAGIKLGYDPTKRSEFCGKTPLEQAQRNRREESLFILDKYHIK
jgi:hypothetical protein